MKINRSVYATAAAAALALAAFGATGAAQARNVFWSVGVNSPGVALGFSNAPPVYYQPQPVYVQPQPVYMEPQGYYVEPGPIYRAGWVRPGYYGERWRGRGGRHEQHSQHGHGDRDR